MEQEGNKKENRYKNGNELEVMEGFMGRLSPSFHIVSHHLQWKLKGEECDRMAEAS